MEAGVVDEQRHVATLLGRRGDVLGIGDVEIDAFGAVGSGFVGVAHAGVHLRRTAGEQLLHERQPDASVGARDQRDRTLQGGHARANSRMTRPGRAPVLTPISVMTAPLTMVAA